MTTFIKAKHKKSDDQTNIDRSTFYSTLAGIINLSLNSIGQF